MIERIKQLVLFIFLIGCGQYAYGLDNFTSVNFTSEKSANIQSNTTSTYNGTTFDVGTYYRLGVQSYRRAFVEFDLGTSIPTNAIIYSASLEITHTGTVNGSNPWRAKLVKSTWDETTVTSSLQPTISTLTGSGDLSSTYTTSGNTVQFDVTTMVQRMTCEQVTNYGWSIQVNNESYAGSTGAMFYSDDYSLSSVRPKLLIVYYIPLSITSATITHESATGAADGAISFTHSNGSATSYTSAWYDSDGTLLTGGASDLTAGWYGVKMTGTNGAAEDFYYAFLVGTHCETVTIDFEAASGNNFSKYVDNAFNSEKKNDVNSGEDANLQTSREYMFPSAFSTNSYLRFNLWMDDAFTITQADLELQGKAHSGGSNAAKFDRVTAAWNENLICWDNQPTSPSTPTVNVAQTTTSTEDETADISGYWEIWKANNTTNHGLIFQLQSFASYTNIQQYHSPTAATVTDKPKVTFTVSLLHSDTPYRCNPNYAKMERRLTGINYKTQLDNVYFYYDNEYASGSTDLTYEIFEYSDLLAPVMIGTSDMLDLGFGRNQYILDVSGSSLTSGESYVLVVTNDKDEKRYLRFEKE